MPRPVQECYLTPEQYLEIETKAEYKSEYFRGRMYLRGGVSINESTIAINLGYLLRPFARVKQCLTLGSDMRVKAGDSGLYAYPDMSVVRRPPIVSQWDNLENPVVLFEIVSPVTEAYDRGLKFEMYRRIESLHSYVLVQHDRAHVEVFTKVAGVWTLSEASGLQASIDIPVLDAHIPLAPLYENVDLETPEQALE